MQQGRADDEPSQPFGEPADSAEEFPHPAPSDPPEITAAPPASLPAARTRPGITLSPRSLQIIAFLLAVAACFLYYMHREIHVPLQVRRLTFREGRLLQARFRPGGRDILYSAAWNDGPLSLYEVLADSPQSHPITSPPARLFAISSHGTLALQTVAHTYYAAVSAGTLALRGLYSDSPQNIADQVSAADWTPGGSAILYAVFDPSGGTVFESYDLEKHSKRRIYPLQGTVPVAPARLRISPDGRYFAFEHHVPGSQAGSIHVVNVATGVEELVSREFASLSGLAWNPAGTEIWFAAAPKGTTRSIYALGLNGRLRYVYGAPAVLTLQDISAEGEVLVTRDSSNVATYIRPLNGSSPQTELPGDDWTILGDVTPDGRRIVFSDSGVGEQKPSVYVHQQGAQAPTWLGDATLPAAISPDGAKVVASTNDVCRHLILFPLDGGGARTMTPEELCVTRVMWLDNSRLVVSGERAGAPSRCFLQTLDGTPQPITPPGFLCLLRAYDQRRVLARGGNAYYAIDSEGKESPRKLDLDALSYSVAGWIDEDTIAAFRDSNPIEVAFFRPDGALKRAYRFDRPANVESILRGRVFGAGNPTFVYSVHHMLSELYLIHGLK
jgi:Tol biopolymer transport system component